MKVSKINQIVEQNGMYEWEGDIVSGRENMDAQGSEQYDWGGEIGTICTIDCIVQKKRGIMCYIQNGGVEAKWKRENESGGQKGENCR